jgi:hypothetical protein
MHDMYKTATAGDYDGCSNMSPDLLFRRTIKRSRLYAWAAFRRSILEGMEW